MASQVDGEPDGTQVLTKYDDLLIAHGAEFKKQAAAEKAWRAGSSPKKPHPGPDWLRQITAGHIRELLRHKNPDHYVKPTTTWQEMMARRSPREFVLDVFNITIMAGSPASEDYLGEFAKKCPDAMEALLDLHNVVKQYMHLARGWIDVYGRGKATPYEILRTQTQLPNRVVYGRPGVLYARKTTAKTIERLERNFREALFRAERGPPSSGGAKSASSSAGAKPAPSSGGAKPGAGPEPHATGGASSGRGA